MVRPFCARRETAGTGGRPPEDTQTGFLDGLRSGGDALRTFAIGLSAVAGALLPWSPLLIAALLLTKRWWPKPRATT